MKGLTDIPGIKVGHASDYEALTGCTAILCEAGAIPGVDVRGSASENQSFGTMAPQHVSPSVHAVVLTGGSAFGLEAASGVRRFLEQKGVGFQFGRARIPIVPCAVIFDLAIGKATVRPTREMGEAAAAAATTEPVKEGCVGAGTGATVGKLYGMRQAMKGGVGSWTVSLESAHPGVLVSALAVVNAFGDIRDPKTAKLVAGARKAPESREFADAEAVMKRSRRGSAPGQNTTLVVVATNARLTKVQAEKLAQFAQVGIARTLSPAHTMADGDSVVALSLGELTADINVLGVAAAEAASEAILRGVKLATSMGGAPGLAP